MDANELFRLLQNLLRKGSVFAVDHNSTPPTCRVRSGDLETNFIPWFTLSAGKTRDWLPPTEGEQVMLLCPGGDPAEGVALRGINSDENPAPSNLPSLNVLRSYPDGAVIQYDHETHALDVTLPEGGTITVISPSAVEVRSTDVIVKAETVKVDAAQTTFTGAVTVEGAFAFQAGMTGQPGAGGGKTMQITGGAEFTEDVKAAGVSVSKHKHPETGSVTEEPQ